MDLTVNRVARLPVLLVITFRPEFQPPWAGQPHVTMLALNRLGQRQVAALVVGLAGCLASQYLATWIILRLGSREDAATALQRATPVGQQAEYISRALGIVEPYLPAAKLQLAEEGPAGALERAS
jgi:hypothetical protein